jgi:lipid-binding SYLF domain-containing protein
LLIRRFIFMNKRLFISLAVATFIGSACATKDPDVAAQLRALDAQADTALAALDSQVPASRELVAKARGVLIFPEVKTAGLVIGGSWGEGVLRSGGSTTGYFRTGGASVGLLAGGDSKAVYVLFMTQEALDKFNRGDGWTVGADASVTFATYGSNASVDTRTGQHPVIGYVLTNSGLLLNVSLDGAKVSRLGI